MFAVRVRVTIDMLDELNLTVMVCGIKIKILPKKQKKYKLSNYTLKKIAKRDKKNALKAEKKARAQALKKKKKADEKKRRQQEQASLTKEEQKAAKALKKASRPPLPPLISLLLKTLGFFFPGLFSKVHFHIARIKLRIGGADAAQTALTYYAISNAISPTLNFIEKHSNLHGRSTAEIDIRPDFLSDEIKADVKIGFSTSLGGILGIALKSGFKLIFGYVKIKPSVPAEHNPPKCAEKSESLDSAKTTTETEKIKRNKST